MKTPAIIRLSVFGLFFCLALSTTAFATREALAAGAYPYNFRMIDSRVYAGGHPLNPETNFGNSDQQTLAILKSLKALGVKTVINLEDTKSIQSRYSKLLQAAGLNQLHVPLNIARVPNQTEWKEITSAMQQPVYIHCKWGADRTGAVVGRYLVEKYQYPPEQAYRAVITGGKYSGPLGGLKTGVFFTKLKEFIWRGP